jgi:predicted nucleotidyltransferase
MFGSWGRGELTAGSDYDWAILTPTGRDEDDDVVRLAARCREMFNDDGKAPGAQAVFGLPFAWAALPEKIGLDEDSNKNLTRRMLTLLESVALTGHVRDECWHAILDRYLAWGVKDPPTAALPPQRHDPLLAHHLRRLRGQAQGQRR